MNAIIIKKMKNVIEDEGINEKKIFLWIVMNSDFRYARYGRYYPT